jgi:predicted Co/Zn/Cd cation transporter (cation efflux family)
MTKVASGRSGMTLSPTWAAEVSQVRLFVCHSAYSVCRGRPESDLVAFHTCGNMVTVLSDIRVFIVFRTDWWHGQTAWIALKVLLVDGAVERGGDSLTTILLRDMSIRRQK